jgi:hypothetical protein
MSGKATAVGWVVGGAAILICMYMFAQFMVMQLTLKL